MARRGVLSLALLAVLASAAAAHPVPKDTHDRTLVVHLVHAKDRPDRLVVTVDYRLEVDELTAFTRDLATYADDLDAFSYRGRPLALYTELARRLGPDLAFRLDAKANGRRIEFACVQHRATLHDEQGTPLGHLRCDFVFTADFPVRSGGENELALRDQTYLDEEGKIDLRFADDAGLKIVRRTVPDEAVRQRPPNAREPGDEDRLRELHVAFLASDVSPLAALPAPEPATPQAAPEDHDDHALLRLLLHADYGFWLTMLLALVFGAAHALTPGHGKTLVAAYLVGERGTVVHAVFLGVVTTLTHTGVVLLIAAVLFFLPEAARGSFGRALHDGLGLVMGLLVVCTGFWLLLQRLSGRADHFHLGGGHHHHHHGGPAVAAQDGSVRWWGLVALGITGGLVPCWDAIYLLLYTVGRRQFLVALPAVLAFSAGLAGVLVLIGVLVVQVPHFARSRWGSGGVVRALPIVSALVVTAMGLWLCYEGVHGR